MPSVPVVVMVVAPIEVDGAVVAITVVTLVAVAVAVAMTVAMVTVVMVVVARPALVPLRGGGAWEQH